MPGRTPAGWAWLWKALRGDSSLQHLCDLDLPRDPPTPSLVLLRTELLWFPKLFIQNTHWLTEFEIQNLSKGGVAHSHSVLAPAPLPGRVSFVYFSIVLLCKC